MPSFEAIGIAGTSMSTNRRWIDATADNLANMNTVTSADGDAFRARYLEVAPNEASQGVQVTGVQYGDAEGVLSYEPDHPEANEEGYVRRPDVDMGVEMGNLIMAQRSYSLASQVVDKAKTVYQAGIEIGRN
ncbi:flagellar basal body rod protein FlgC [Citricoccus sp. GCM10030269]|uniref:flagellar basal body rod protein FlgC n=1 Tax=Citricoccus sp. GCM10030269 TaxID=3273388 RepID=UPI00360F69AD